MYVRIFFLVIAKEGEKKAMKKISKIMVCIVLCLSMMMPVYASTISYPSDYPDLSDTPYALEFDTTNGGGSHMLLVSSSPFVFVKSEVDSSGTKYIFESATKIIEWSKIKFDDGYRWYRYGYFSGGLSFSLHADKYPFLFISHDILDADGNVIYKGTNSDTPPQPDVPTVPSWMETVNVWNPQWMTVVIGSTICLVALGICLDWLVRRFRRSAR